MKRSLFLWQLFGATFTAVLGTLLHFLFVWTDWIFLAPFAAVNESTWEHMKILFFPLVFFAVLQSRFFRLEYPSFWTVKLIGTIFGVLLIPVLFYTILGSFGVSPAWVNVTIFFLADFSAYGLEWTLFKNLDFSDKKDGWAVLILLLFAAAFILFTFYPPHIPLFQDPITGGYSIV